MRFLNEINSRKLNYITHKNCLKGETGIDMVVETNFRFNSIQMSHSWSFVIFHQLFLKCFLQLFNKPDKTFKKLFYT